MSTTTLPASTAPPRAGIADVLAVNALVFVPNLLQGLFRRRSAAVRVATALDLDGRAVEVLASMAQRYRRPVRIRAGTTEAVLLLDPRAAAGVLDGSIDDYAADPDPKRRGMAHFQPGAVTISRGDQWRDRSRFTDRVLGAVPGLAGRIGDLAAAETARLIDSSPVLTWTGWNRMHQRIARRVILGDAAVRDEALTGTLERMMAEANWLPAGPSKHIAGFHDTIGQYLDRAEPGSLAAAIANTSAGQDTEPAAQITHWLFALGDTLASNTLRTLAIVGQRPAHRDRALADDTGEYLSACVQETMRLWPTTPVLSRQTRKDLTWGDGTTVPSGTQLLIVNTFFHRDPAHVPDADQFVPGRWLAGDAASTAAFNHFSRGPQRCAGVGLALLVGRSVLRVALEHTLAVAAPPLPEPLPHMLDHFRIRVATA